MPLLPLEPMGQLRRGVTQILAVHLPLVVVIPRFIQPREPLLPLKLKIHLSKAVWFNVIFACNGID
jgi:hypothetical protein